MSLRHCSAVGRALQSTHRTGRHIRFSGWLPLCGGRLCTLMQPKVNRKTGSVSYPHRAERNEGGSADFLGPTEIGLAPQTAKQVYLLQYKVAETLINHRVGDLGT